MTPTEMISPEDNTSKVRSDMNAQSLYDKCMAVAQQLMVDVATGSYASLSRSRPDSVASTRPQPNRAVERILLQNDSISVPPKWCCTAESTMRIVS